MDGRIGKNHDRLIVPSGAIEKSEEGHSWPFRSVFTILCVNFTSFFAETEVYLLVARNYRQIVNDWTKKTCPPPP
jgi:hypothetical protein